MTPPSSNTPFNLAIAIADSMDNFMEGYNFAIALITAKGLSAWLLWHTTLLSDSFSQAYSFDVASPPPPLPPGSSPSFWSKMCEWTYQIH
jgi:hypothetical protein